MELLSWLLGEVDDDYYHKQLNDLPVNELPLERKSVNKSLKECQECGGSEDDINYHKKSLSIIDTLLSNERND